MEHEENSDTKCNWCNRNNYQRLGKGPGKLRYQITSGDHPDYSLIKISESTKFPGDLGRLAITQTPVIAGVKISRGVIILIIVPKKKIDAM